jgi:translocation and assembly module TamB
MRAACWLALGLLLLGPAWLLGTASGLRVALYAAERATGDAFSVESADGRLAGDVELRGVRYADGGVTVTIARAVLNLRASRLAAGRVQAEHLLVEQLDIAVHEGAPPPDAGAEEPLTVEAPLRLAVEEGRLDGFSLTLSGGARWQLPRARFAARWRDRWIVIGRLEADTAEAGAVVLSGRLAIADDQLLLEGVQLEQPGAIRLDGSVALGDRAESALRVSWSGLPAGLPYLPAWLSTREGRIELDGPWRDYAFSLEAQLRAADIDAEASARGRGSLEGLRLQRTHLRALGGEVHAEGQVRWAGGVRTALDLRWRALDPGRRLAQWPGVLNGEGRLAAEFGEVTHLDFEASLRDSQLRGYPLALQARGTTQGGAVQLSQLVLRSGPSELTARGALLPALDLRGRLQSSDLRSLWAGLEGRAQLSFGARGEPAAPAISLAGQAQDVAYGALRAGQARVDGTLALAGRSDLRVAAEAVEAGIALRTLSLALEGRSERHRLRARAAGEQGAVSLELAGGWRAGWRGALASATVDPAEGGSWTLEEAAAVRFARGELAIEPACFAGGGSRACAEFQTAPSGQHLAFRLHAFALAHLQPWLPREWRVSGTLGGTASLRIAGGELRAIRANLATSAGAIEAAGVRLDYGPGRLQVQPQDERLHALLELQPAGGQVRGELWLAAGAALLDRPLVGDLRVALPDLAWLPVLSPQIGEAEGAIDADLHVSGSLRSPSLDGRLHVANGRVQLTTPGIELTDITASFERGVGAPLKARVEAASGGGRFTLEGEVAALQPKLAGRFTLKGRRVQGYNTSELRAWISPDLSLVLDGRHARLTGEVVVPRAQITPRGLDRGGVAPSGDQEIVQAEEARTGAFIVESEVRVTLGDEVHFDGLGLKSRLAGALTARDEPGRPTTGRGELRLEGGRYKAYGQELQIETGRLLFTGGPITDPAIDISAFRKPREDIKVGLRARGALGAPEFSLYSEPAMSQEEQLSWLVLGRSLSGTLDSGQRQQLSGAAASLGLAGGEFLAQRFAPRLGLDEVSVGARPGETADLARLTIGKYLSPRLFLSYGVGLFQPGHFFRMQYDLGRRFKLVGESGANQGGDLLYSIER